MAKNPQRPVSSIAFPILVALSISHCLNDLLQSVITATYPLFKTDLALSFAQIGLITLVYQMSASVFQPVFGLFFDKHPIAWTLPAGMLFTMTGLLNLAFAGNLYWVLFSVFLIGIGSSVLHPEASRITSLASGGRRGLAQSLFQVGGNLGGSLGPLLVAILVAPYGRGHIAVFAILVLTAIIVMVPVCKWYKRYLERIKREPEKMETHLAMPLPMGKTILAISILLILIFSKYIYMASLNSYYTFYLIHKFGVSVQQSQLFLFIFLIATAIGTLVGGPLGDRIGRKYIIWISILGTAPFSLWMPHVGLAGTVMLSFCVGLMLSSAFPAILLYAQELLPNKLGLISGLFFGFAFGVAGIASAVLGNMADKFGIESVYNTCAFMPLLGFVTCFLPNLKKRIALK
ncbi:MFS transporter [Oscillospiraceae bacterium N12]|jgi:FSR family fosmidomycin resistance protein-like MFS transporter|uniref:MFS transporter n=1 Tax=Jilunia laotingensis TaxID=2763675 RepID=A0A926F5D5_9BACT|nr:MFS transporter [Jilunia laotingensis]MBC8594503.1 MFS transporter [Jilunia laotingensis]